MTTKRALAKAVEGTKPAARKRHAAQREETEQWLDSKGVQWVFVPDVSLDSIDKEKSLRNQARITQVLNEERLETYTEAMERGDVFPAAVAYLVEGMYVLIDGNHRLQAAENAGKKLSLYVVDSDTDSRTIITMTYEANAKHGLPNSVEDRQLHAVYLLRSGAASQEVVAAALNLSKGQVQKAWQKSKADERAHEMGILERQWVQLPVASRLRLGAIRTDEGFSAMADLAIRGGLSSAEIDQHVVAINRARSAKGQKDLVAEFTPLYRKRIQQSAGGMLKSGKGEVGPKRYYQMGVGQINRFKDEVDDIVAAFHDAEVSEALEMSKTLGNIVLQVIDGLEARQKKA